eukprot:m.45905 g.45905  ORF g.45905 m.45905 type:complete len:352 (+) comp10308_c0_seq2:146-1201(+)
MADNIGDVPQAKPLVERVGPQKKTIEVNAASLVDLRVELQRKQEQYRLELLDPTLRERTRKATKGPTFLQNKGVSKRAQKDEQQHSEDAKDLERSARMLAKKAELYEKLHRDGVTKQQAEEFLVDFEMKERPDEEDSEELPKAFQEGPRGGRVNNNLGVIPDKGNDMVEYEDSFGRTRTCLRKDLPAILEAEERHKAELHGDDRDNKPELLSDDMRRELDRQQWEQEAQSEVKQGNVGPTHFQSVIPGEIRQLGTGYFRFSTDEEKRSEQMAHLNSLRDETIVQRNRREDIKNRRKAALQARMNKIKKRKGLKSTTDEQTQDNEEEENEEPVAAESIDDFLAFMKQKAKES